MLRDADAANDATHETFIRVFGNLDKAPSGDGLLRWMYRIATNHCLNEIRNTNAAARSMTPLALDAEGTLPRAEEALADRDLVRRVLAAVPEKLVVVSVMRHVGGMHDAEVARALGISRRTVVYRLAEFKEHVQRLVGQVDSRGRDLPFPLRPITSSRAPFTGSLRRTDRHPLDDRA